MTGAKAAGLRAEGILIRTVRPGTAPGQKIRLTSPGGYRKVTMLRAGLFQPYRAVVTGIYCRQAFFANGTYRMGISDNFLHGSYPFITKPYVTTFRTADCFLFTAYFILIFFFTL